MTDATAHHATREEIRAIVREELARLQLPTHQHIHIMLRGERDEIGDLIGRLPGLEREEDT